MVNYEARLDAVFAALAHSARRAMLVRLSQGVATVGELGEPLDMSAPAVTKHLKVLERARLISRGRDAQWRPCQLEMAALRTAGGWIEEQRHAWESRLDRLEGHLHQLEQAGGGRHGKR
jgi:DNA-binding transcriptional ArsR family regulator